MRIDKAKVKEILEEELRFFEGYELEEEKKGFINKLLSRLTAAMPFSAAGRTQKGPVSPAQQKALDLAPYVALGPSAPVGGTVLAMRAADSALRDPKASTGEKLARTGLAIAQEIPAGKALKVANRAHDAYQIAGGEDLVDVAAQKVFRHKQPPGDVVTTSIAPGADYLAGERDYGGRKYKSGTGLEKVSEGVKHMKSIDLIKALVEQELREIDGGIMDPNMVPFVPHRMPGSDTGNEPREPTKTDRLYSVAVKARIATEDLVKALDEPIYDQAYEAAFKATMALRDSLNALMAVGAHPPNRERIVAPDVEEQPVGSAVGVKHMPMTYTGDNV